MMRWIIGASLQSRLVVAALAVGLIYFGITQLPKMPVDALPEFSQPYVEIQTEAPGLSAAEVEALITVPLEADMLNGTAWGKEIRSQSIPGLSSIVILFNPGTDIMRARQMVMERLTQVYTLPNVGKPPVLLNPVSSTSRVMMIGLTSETMSPIDMSVLARWTIAPRLSGINGVANVSIWGERRRQLQVLVDPQKLAAANVALQQIINTAGNALWFSPLSYLSASTPGASGFIDTPNQRLGVRHKLPISTPEEFAQITVEGTTSRLGDITKVVEDHQPLIGDALVNDKSSVILVVEKLPNANTLSVTQEIEKTLDSLRPGLAGLHMDSTLFRPATYIESAIANLKVAVLIGTALVVVALGAFLLDARATLIAAVAVLLSYIGAVAVLYVAGASLNTMILLGLVLALGAVIDDAVVDIDNVVARLHEHRQTVSSRSFARVILEASLEFRGTLLYATVVLLLVAVPTYVLGGVEGAFLRSLALGYGLAMLVSMLIALTATPALCILLLPSSPLAGYHSAIVEQVRRIHGFILATILEHPRKIFATTVCVSAAGLAALLLLPRHSLIPTFNERDVLVEIDSAPGTSQPAMSRIAGQATRELRAVPGVRTVSAQIGRAVLSDHIGDVNTGKLWISMNHDADYQDTLDRINQVVNGYAGLDIDARTYLAACTTDERGAPVGSEDNDIVVRVYGDDWKVLKEKATEVAKALSGIRGIVAPEVELPLEESQVEIQVKIDAAKEHGLKPGDVRRAAATLLSGIEVGYLFEAQKVFDVVVWGEPGIRDNLSKIQNLRIDAPGGKQVLLRDVADIRIAAAPTSIKREAVARYIDVVAMVQGRSLAPVVGQVEQVLREIEFPLEYRAELMRGAAERLAARSQFTSSAIAAAIGFILILQACLGSWSLAFVLCVAVPAALSGGALTAWAVEGSWSLGIVLGLFAVLTITLRNSLSLVKHFQRANIPAETVQFSGNGAQFHCDSKQPHVGEALSSEKESSAAETIRHRTWNRFTPILMTAVITAAVFVPFVVMRDVPGNEVLRTMAIVVLGGLATSTLFTLLAIPAIVLMFAPRQQTELDDLAHDLLSEAELRDHIAEQRIVGAEHQASTIDN